VSHSTVLSQIPNQVRIVEIIPGASNSGLRPPFDPPTVEISLIGPVTVKWTNEDSAYHTVTAVDKSFESPLIAPTKSFNHLFDSPGYYNYFCSLHPYMTGIVIVTNP